MIKAIIFDADGPLYYRKPEVIEQQLALLNKYGYPASLSGHQIAHLNKYGHLGDLHEFNEAYESEKLKAYVRAESVPTMVQHVLHAIGLELTGAKLSQFAEAFAKQHSEITPTADAVSTLTKLKAQSYKTCVLTDSFYSSEDKWRWFASVGLDSVLDCMVSSYDIRKLKDTPEAYEACLRLLGTTASETIFVGHQQYEMDGAKESGILSIAILPIATPHIRTDYTLNSLSELPGLLMRLNQSSR